MAAQGRRVVVQSAFESHEAESDMSLLGAQGRRASEIVNHSC